MRNFVSTAAMLLVFLSCAIMSAEASSRRSSPACAGPECENPGCAAPVCRAPVISYRHALLSKARYGCKAPQKLILVVKDPCCCDNFVEVPVCIPACCDGEPCVKDRCGLFGRGIVWYEWCCGFKVKLVFDKCGDVHVTYYGK